MDISAALAADLAALTEALDDEDVDLQALLRTFGRQARSAVSSYLGLSMTIAADAHEVSFTIRDGDTAAAEIGTSLLIPLPALSGTPAGGSLVLYAATPGAFVDLAADLSYALGLDRTHLVLDQHLIAPTAGSGMGLDTQSAINQAIGVLIGGGHTLESARHELDRLASLDSDDLHRAAQAVLASVLAPPAGDPGGTPPPV